MRKHQRRNTYDMERASAAATRRVQASARSRQTPPTSAQHELLERFAKEESLTSAEYATLAQHPMISDAARNKFMALAAA